MIEVLDEKKKYEQLWNHKDYEDVSPGELLWDYFKPLLEKGKLLTDFGCGSAKAIHHYLELGLQVQLVDIASNCLSLKASLLLRFCPEQV